MPTEYPVKQSPAESGLHFLFPEYRYSSVRNGSTSTYGVFLDTNSSSLTNGSSNINGTDVDDYDYDGDVGGDQRLWEIGIGYIVPVICVLGIIGNSLSLLVLNKPKFSTVMYVYVRWMSFSDLLAMILVIPQSISSSVPSVSFGNSYAMMFYFAHLSLPLINTFFGTSTLLIVFMTLERYLSVCHPLATKNWSTECCARLCVALSFILCLICYVPMIFEFYPEAIQRVDDMYFVEWNADYASSYFYRQVYSWCRAVFIRFIPFIVVLTLNTRTLLAYRQVVFKRRRMVTRKRREQRQHQEENCRMVIMASTAILYVVCLFPMPIAHVLISTQNLEQNFTFQMYMVIGNNLEVSNAALNFYMYCLASKDFRKCLGDSCSSCCSCCPCDPALRRVPSGGNGTLLQNGHSYVQTEMSEMKAVQL